MKKDQPTDPRHNLIKLRILERYARANHGLPCPWDGRCGSILNRILKSNPSWPVEIFLRAVDNRFASEGINAAAAPVDWLDNRHERLVNYAESPLDLFKRPKRRLQEDVIREYWESRNREMN